jgi:hypothetical protein
MLAKLYEPADEHTAVVAWLKTLLSLWGQTEAASRAEQCLSDREQIALCLVLVQAQRCRVRRDTGFAHAEHRNLLADHTFPGRREWRSPMRHLLCAVAALGIVGFASCSASAADLGRYEERETYVERPARVIERERIVERQYYEPRYSYYDEPDVYDVPRPRVYRYYAADYPYYYRPRFYYRDHYWRGHHGRW